MQMNTIVLLVWLLAVSAALSCSKKEQAASDQDSGIALKCTMDCKGSGCFLFRGHCLNRCESNSDCPATEVCVCPDKGRCLFSEVVDESPNPGKNFCVPLPPSLEGKVSR